MDGQTDRCETVELALKHRFAHSSNNSIHYIKTFSAGVIKPVFGFTRIGPRSNSPENNFIKVDSGLMMNLKDFTYISN